MKLEIDFADVLHLIQQFCLENNLLSSFEMLQSESKIKYTALSSVQDLISNIYSGKWDLVLSQSEVLSLSTETRIDLYELIVLELIEEREIPLARSILRDSKTMNMLRESDSERYLKLEYSLSSHLTLLDKEEKRTKLARQIVSEVSLVPPGRLISLLKIAALKEARELNANDENSPLEIKFFNKESKISVNDGKEPQFNSTNSLSTGSSTSPEQFIHYDIFRGNLRSALNEELSCTLFKEILLPNSHSAESIAFSPNGALVAIGTSDGCIQLWNPLTGSLCLDFPFQAESRFMQHEKECAILSLAFSPNEDSQTLVASADEKGNCKVWSCSSGSAISTFMQVHQSGITSLNWSKQSSQLLTSSYDKTCKIISLKTGAVLRVFRGHESWVSSAAYSSDFNSIISTSNDGSCRIWNVDSGECIKIIRPASNALSFVVPIATSFFIGGSSSSCCCMINSRGKIENNFAFQVLNCAASPRADSIWAISAASELILFDLCLGKKILSQQVSSAELICLAVHPFQNVVVVASEEGKVYFYRTNPK
jgi:WD40 repeat-containing protein SMU1